MVPDPIIIWFIKMEDHDRLLNAFEHHPRHAQKNRNYGWPPAEPVTITEHTPSTAPDAATE